MPVFSNSFLVKSDLETVSAFHRDTSALKKLSPPPMFVQLHEIEPLAEGSTASFTLWFGPIPLPWKAVHQDVSTNGFIDEQITGPMRVWRHHHHFEQVSEKLVKVTDTVQYQFPDGLRGFFLRLLFNKAALRFLFAFRSWITRRNTEKKTEPL